MALRLIQRLTTSNPSPDYIARVATVFNNNGQGVRGDLGAVVKAILLDPEIRSQSAFFTSWMGKGREPVLTLSAVARAAGAIRNSPYGGYNWGVINLTTELNQMPMKSPSVFNFYLPDFEYLDITVPGLQGLYAPEFQLINSATILARINSIANRLFLTRFDFAPLQGFGSFNLTSGTFIEDNVRLVNYLNLNMAAGALSQQTVNRIILALNTRVRETSISGLTGDALFAEIERRRFRYAIMLVTSSPEFQVQL